jgi:hypothetical protein
MCKYIWKRRLSGAAHGVLSAAAVLSAVAQTWVLDVSRSMTVQAREGTPHCFYLLGIMEQATHGPGMRRALASDSTHRCTSSHFSCHHPAHVYTRHKHRLDDNRLRWNNAMSTASVAIDMYNIYCIIRSRLHGFRSVASRSNAVS